jgi:hypothetical protein
MAMSLSAFANEVETDPRTLPLLREIARQAATDDHAGPPPTYVDPVVVPLIGIAAIALYRAVTILGDYLDGRAELDLAARQAALVTQLVDDGLPREKAQKVVAAMLKDLRGRTADDEALKAVLEIARKYPTGA